MSELSYFTNTIENVLTILLLILQFSICLYKINLFSLSYDTLCCYPNIYNIIENRINEGKFIPKPIPILSQYQPMFCSITSIAIIQHMEIEKVDFNKASYYLNREDLNNLIYATQPDTNNK